MITILLFMEQEEILLRVISPQRFISQAQLGGYLAHLFASKATGRLISINPEGVMHAVRNPRFYESIQGRDCVYLCDGVGIVWALRLLKKVFLRRYPGVEAMRDILNFAQKNGKRVLFLGSTGKVLSALTNHLKREYPHLVFFTDKGLMRAPHVTKEEKNNLNKIFTEFKPEIVFVALGMPKQELIMEQFVGEYPASAGRLFAGVGGAFEYLAKTTPRAPAFIRVMGLEWLFRLIIQPWRIKRQLALISFTSLLARVWLQKVFHGQKT